VTRALVVEDEPAIADAVAYSLRGEGHEVEVVGDGEAALEAATASSFDVVILDIMLPGVSGLEVCRRLRAESDVPIIMLTARDAEVDRVVGLEAGADDYVSKPFSMAELVSRVRAILRRRDLDRGTGAHAVRVGEIELDPMRHEVRVAGRPVQLTPSEFRLLALLAAHPDRVFSRRELMEHLWNSTHIGDQRAADMHVLNLRRKLEEDAKQPRRLVTVRGVGYKLARGVSKA
jgi:two-component system response regulator RegX3